MQIILENITKRYKNVSAIENISAEIQEGEVVALIGPSGSGKTTLLKIIAGLEAPSSGKIFINNINVNDLPMQNRGIGFVFQHYALFKHMNVYENIAFAYKVKPKKFRLDKNLISRKVHELANLVQIGDLLDRYPHQLSGGQRQRVALARALAVEPKILLLDEPFAALDAKLKLELRRWIRKLKKDTNITIILVTHDQEEALDLADKVFIFNKGKIEQIGNAEEIYHVPANSFVYNFLGHYNVFRAIKSENDKISILNKEQSLHLQKEKWYSKNKIVSNLFSLLKTSKNKTQTEKIEHEYVEVFVRPHDITITRDKLDDEAILATVTHINVSAPFVKIELEAEKYELIHAEISHEKFKQLNIKKNDSVYVKPRQMTVFVD